MAKPKNIPILVDAAAEVLTIRVYTAAGRHGRRLQRRKGDLRSTVRRAAAGSQGSPHVGVAGQLATPWPGRDNKSAAKNVGMLAAVEAWVKRDHAGEWKKWLSWLDNISKRVSTIDSVKTAVREPTGLSNRSPELIITWDRLS